MTIAVNEKVYILSKSYGDSLDSARDRQQRCGRYHSEMITVNGENRIAMIGYYTGKSKYMASDTRISSHDINYPDIFVIDYGRPALSGDYYERQDFLTESDLSRPASGGLKFWHEGVITLDDSLFEL
jgi:hypothetical protein